MGRGRRSQILVQVAGIPSLIARRVLSRLRDKGVPEEVVPAQGRRWTVLRFPRLLDSVSG